MNILIPKPRNLQFNDIISAFQDVDNWYKNVSMQINPPCESEIQQSRDAFRKWISQAASQLFDCSVTCRSIQNLTQQDEQYDGRTVFEELQDLVETIDNLHKRTGEMQGDLRTIIESYDKLHKEVQNQIGNDPQEDIVDINMSTVYKVTSMVTVVIAAATTITAVIAHKLVGVVNPLNLPIPLSQLNLQNLLTIMIGPCVTTFSYCATNYFLYRSWNQEVAQYNNRIFDKNLLLHGFPKTSNKFKSIIEFLTAVQVSWSSSRQELQRALDQLESEDGYAELRISIMVDGEPKAWKKLGEEFKNGGHELCIL